jgi:hypothetical protein
MPSRAHKLKKLQNRSRQPGQFSDWATSDDQPATTTYLSIIDGVRTTEDLPLLPEIPLLTPSDGFSAEDASAISEFVGLDEDQINANATIKNDGDAPTVEKDEAGPKTQVRFRFFYGYSVLTGGPDQSLSRSIPGDPPPSPQPPV